MKVFIELAVLFAIACAQVNLRQGFHAADVNKDNKITRDELTAVFNSFDDDANGKVNVTEFIKHFSRTTGFTVEATGYIFYLIDSNEDGDIDTTEINALFDNFDSNGDGHVTIVEYDAVMQRLAQQLGYLQQEELKLAALYSKADVNKDGVLSYDELNAVFMSADTDNDGKITEDEFVKMWLTNTGDSAKRSAILFGFLDRDGNGFYGGTPEEKKAVAAPFDTNRDGKIDKNEWNFRFVFIAARLQRIEDAQRVIGF